MVATSYTKSIFFFWGLNHFWLCVDSKPNKVRRYDYTGKREKGSKRKVLSMYIVSGYISGFIFSLVQRS